MGKFIVFEGIDKCGKSTQLSKVKEWLESQNRKVYTFREPGTTPVGTAIRNFVKDTHGPVMSFLALKHLFMAARAELINNELKYHVCRNPELPIVLCDRYALSTLCYQVLPDFKQRLDEFDIDGEEVVKKFVEEMDMMWNRKPDLTLIFDIDIKTHIERSKRFDEPGRPKDRFEINRSYLEEALNNYKEVAKMPAYQRDEMFGQCEIVDATLSEDQVFDAVKRIINSHILNP